MINSKAGVVCTVLVILSLLVSPAAADIGWTYQQIGSSITGGDPGNIALAMRTGSTWPTVFYEDTSAQQLLAASMTPVGWLSSALGAPNTTQDSGVRAKSGQDGRVGVAYLREHGVGFNQSSSLGWQGSGFSIGTIGEFDTPDFDYLSGNRPLVAFSESNDMYVSAYDGLGWNTEQLDWDTGGGAPQPMGYRVSMAVDSQDRIGLASCDYDSDDVNFAFKNQLAGTWAATTIGDFPGVQHLSFAFGPNDEPGLTVLGGGVLTYASYDIQSGDWQFDLIATGVTSDRVNLVFNSQGHPAVAYVGYDTVFYSINDGNGWADFLLPIGTDPASGLNIDPHMDSDAALAFDADDVPLIAFYEQSDGLLLAYDPIVPEPTSFALLCVGVCLATRRRRTR